MESRTLETESPAAPLDVEALLARPTVSTGSILKRSLRLYLRNFIPFIILSGLVQVPGLVYSLTREASTSRFDLGTIVNAVLGNVATGIMTYAVFMQLRGQKVGIGQSIAVGFRRLLPLLGVGLVAGVLEGLGYLALLVPGVILSCIFFVAVPVTVVEQPGVFAALGRSNRLTLNYKLSIFGFLFILGLASLVPILAMGYQYRDSIMAGELPLTFAIASWAIGLVLGGWTSVASVVTYHDLRLLKEGTEVDDLVKVFE